MVLFFQGCNILNQAENFESAQSQLSDVLAHLKKVGPAEPIDNTEDNFRSLGEELTAASKVDDTVSDDFEMILMNQYCLL